MPTPLLLSASRASWAAASEHGTERENDPRLLKIRDRILKRDNFVCQGCGWRSERHQEIHHRNDDHRDFRDSNLETLCPLCHQVFHLPLVALNSGGSLMWLPEMTQAEVNLLCIPLFVAMKADRHPWYASARQMYSLFQNRTVFMETKLGSSDPADLAQVLVNLTPDRYAQRETMVGSVRLLPHPSRFQMAIDYWNAAYFQDPSPDKWETILPASFDLASVVDPSGAAA